MILTKSKIYERRLIVTKKDNFRNKIIQEFEKVFYDWALVLVCEYLYKKYIKFFICKGGDWWSKILEIFIQKNRPDLIDIFYDKVSVLSISRETPIILWLEIQGKILSFKKDAYVTLIRHG